MRYEISNFFVIQFNSTFYYNNFLYYFMIYLHNLKSIEKSSISYYNIIINIVLKYFIIIFIVKYYINVRLLIYNIIEKFRISFNLF